MTRIVAIGLMSGTSCDGADAALLKTDGESDIEFLGGLTVHYDAVFRSESLRQWRESLELLEPVLNDDDLPGLTVRNV